jgi:voltage-gated potassium channel
MRKQIDTFLLRRGSLVLMWLVIAETLASPIADRYPHIGAAMALIIVLGVLLGARLAVNKKIVIRVVVPLSGLWILARLAEGLSNGQHSYNLISHSVGLTLSCAILWALFDHLHASQVTSSVIAEAIVSYLVIAISFSQLYWILNELVINSFNQKITAAESAEFLYFSMITLTSIGYGGIVPVNPFVRLIAALESVTGIFYVAIVVARLVSAYRPPQEQDDTPIQKRKDAAKESERQIHGEMGSSPGDDNDD